MEKIPYVHPIDKAIEPQKYLTQELLNKNAPGCSISGTFKLRKVAGNFHIALGKNLMASQKGVTHTSNTPQYNGAWHVAIVVRQIIYEPFLLFLVYIMQPFLNL